MLIYFLVLEINNLKMSLNTVPHPPNAAWMPPIDPNDEEALEQEQMLIEEEFKAILSHDITNTMGNIELRQQEQEQQEDQEGDDLQEYGDEIQLPGQQEI